MIPLRRVAAWVLPAAVVLTVVCGVAYGQAQQVLRSSANDPQEQLATDASQALDAGAAPATLVGPGSAVASLAGPNPVTVATSLAPFLVIYDAAGGVLASNGSLDASPPTPPSGVLAAARSTGHDAVTWQPRPGVRIAAVVVPWNGGSVLAGRSLRLVEQREDNALTIAALAWIVGMAGIVIAAIVAERLTRAPAPADGETGRSEDQGSAAE